MADPGSSSAIILTALPVEYQAVRRHLQHLIEDVHKGTVYEVGELRTPNWTWRVGIAEIGKGNPRAAFEAERAVEHFRPTVAMFVGVAGGIKDTELGDVVAATKVYGYESGKEGEEFLPRPEIGSSTYAMEQRARAEARKEAWVDRIEPVKGQPYGKERPRCFVGPIAAGEKVVAEQRSNLYAFLRRMYSDALAVEMEGIGFLQALHANRAVEALVVRGVSDLVAGKEAADQAGMQGTASRHASAFAFEVLCKHGEQLYEAGSTEWTLWLSGTLRDVDRPRIEAIAEHLRILLDDARLSLVRVTEGSIVLTLRSSSASFERMSTEYRAGRLTSVLGHEILRLESGLQPVRDKVAVQAVPRTASRRILLTRGGGEAENWLRETLEGAGYVVMEVGSVRQVVERTLADQPDLVVLDITLPELDGVAVMRSLRERGLDTPVLALSDYSDVGEVLELAREGVEHILKPVTREQLLSKLETALGSGGRGGASTPASTRESPLIGSSAAMRAVRESIARVAQTNAMVLITGEAGTGKGIVANQIHQLSERRDRTQVALNCAALPEELLEAELFGGTYVSSGRTVDRPLFAVADGGTLFLDSVGNLPPRLQVRMLRFLEEGTVKAAGTDAERVDVRILAADENLEGAIAAGRFREDLYYRLNTFALRMPALREHSEDIPELVAAFAKDFALDMSLRPRDFAPDALDYLASLPWPGNVRELHAAVERILLSSGTDPVTRDEVIAVAGKVWRGADDSLATLERQLVLESLRRHDFDAARAASQLGVSTGVVEELMRRLNINPSGGRV